MLRITYFILIITVANIACCNCMTKIRKLNQDYRNKYLKKLYKKNCVHLIGVL